MAQLNFLVGDIEGNCDKILQSIENAKIKHNVHCIVFSELALTGYPPEDLLFRGKINNRIQLAVERILSASEGITIILGAPWSSDDYLYNAALIIQNGYLKHEYNKIELPNYNVFDEKRYFTAGEDACVVELEGIKLGVTICEDVWQQRAVNLSKRKGAELIVNINASPFHIGKPQLRENTLRERINENSLPILYLNQVGGQDELVFDGSSFALDAQGKKIAQAKLCAEDEILVEIDEATKSLKSVSSSLNDMSGNELTTIYQVLQYGLKEYINKNNFKGGVIGLSGGIDSALVLTLAVDALGADKIHAVMMPSQYTSDMSLQDARQLAENLNVRYSVIEIDALVAAFEESLTPLFEGTCKDTTEENIQARIRGVLLMAISNKFGSMVISTGNKSEMAVGYATLYGDMAGGFAPLKDVPKMLVYELSRYRNSINKVIPDRIIDRPPSAELAPDQIDEDSLPPYEVLDQILELFIEQDRSREEIIAKGFEEEEVSRIIKMIFQNETRQVSKCLVLAYKRRQAPPGVKITQRAFGKDRRYPITSGVIKYLQN